MLAKWSQSHYDKRYTYLTSMACAEVLAFTLSYAPYTCNITDAISGLMSTPHNKHSLKQNRKRAELHTECFHGFGLVTRAVAGGL